MINLSQDKESEKSKSPLKEIICDRIKILMDVLRPGTNSASQCFFFRFDCASKIESFRDVEKFAFEGNFCSKYYYDIIFPSLTRVEC